ncbi:MAG: hypothetical protein FWD34_03395 [Oscillospiraceae bacterium]|nr:hypothetical protein [Oscillospiraceae bacterium]
MPSTTEIRVWQKTSLFKLLKLEKELGKSDALGNLILAEKAGMEAEDVAYVEKMITQLK